MKLSRWFLPCTALLMLICAGACDKNYVPPDQTFTGHPEYAGVGISVWGGTVTPVVIGGPYPVVVPETDPSVEIKAKQAPLDPIF